MDDQALDGLQIRAATVTDVDEEKGLVEVRIVPYEHEVQLAPNYWEVFSRGAFAAAVKNPTRCKMSNQQHDRDHPIGVATELRSTDEALEGTIHIPPTELGRDALLLMQAGVTDEISVEFMPMKKHRLEVWKGNDLHIRHDRAELLGLSPVTAGAFGQDARVLAIRNRQDRTRERELAYLATLNAGLDRA